MTTAIDQLIRPAVDLTETERAVLAEVWHSNSGHTARTSTVAYTQLAEMFPAMREPSPATGGTCELQRILRRLHNTGCVIIEPVDRADDPRWLHHTPTGDDRIIITETGARTAAGHYRRLEQACLVEAIETIGETTTILDRPDDAAHYPHPFITRLGAELGDLLALAGRAAVAAGWAVVSRDTFTQAVTDDAEHHLVCPADDDGTRQWALAAAYDAAMDVEGWLRVMAAATPTNSGFVGTRYDHLMDLTATLLHRAAHLAHRLDPADVDVPAAVTHPHVFLAQVAEETDLRLYGEDIHATC